MANQFAYATLVRGICHELKNPLNIISLKAQALPFKLDDRNMLLKDAKDTLVQIKRLKETIQNMLRFGLDGSPERESLSMNDVIINAMSLSEDFFRKKGIEIHHKLREIPLIQANGHQMEQVLLNFMINAAEAMPKGGILTFETKEALFFSPKEKNSETEGIAVQISDTGIGMNEKIQKGIFDAFQTSKKGNAGLGLSICLRIISNHGGFPRVSSKVGEGTTFTILLPLKHQPPEIKEKIKITDMNFTENNPRNGNGEFLEIGAGKKEAKATKGDELLSFSRG